MRTTLDWLFIAHPRAVNEDYLSHAGVAMRFALLLLSAGLAALVHAGHSGTIQDYGLINDQEAPRRDDEPLHQATKLMRCHSAVPFRPPGAGATLTGRGRPS